MLLSIAIDIVILNSTHDRRSEAPPRPDRPTGQSAGLPPAPAFGRGDDGSDRVARTVGTQARGGIDSARDRVQSWSDAERGGQSVRHFPRQHGAAGLCAARARADPTKGGGRTVTSSAA